jgi:Ca2+-binding RTX toxin-like protein
MGQAATSGTISTWAGYNTADTGNTSSTITFSGVNQFLLSDISVAALQDGYSDQTGSGSYAPSNSAGDIVVMPTLSAGEVGYAFAGTSGADTFNLTIGTSSGDLDPATDGVVAFGNGGNDIFNINSPMSGLLIGDSGSNTFDYSNYKEADNTTHGIVATLQGFSGETHVDGLVTSRFASSNLNNMIWDVGTFTGSAGNDQINLNGSGLVNNAPTINGGGGNDLLTLAAGGQTVTVAGIKAIAALGSGNDTITATGSVAATISGGGGNDTITGGSGNDTINGGAGNDTFIDGIGSGNDNYNGGTGTDTIDYSSATAAVTVNLGTGSATGGGNDTLSSIENVIGGAGSDTVTLGGGGQTVSVSGVETVTGGAGNDTITITGGAVTITGGGGADTIHLASSSTQTISYTETTDGAAAGANTGYDTITSFASGSDKIALAGSLLSAIDHNVNGSIDWTTDPTSTVNFNGTSGSDALLLTSSGISNTDLTGGTSGDFANVLTAINGAGVTASSGADALIVVDGSSQAAVYSYHEYGTTNGGAIDHVDAGDLSMLTLVDTTLVATDFSPSPPPTDVV